MSSSVRVALITCLVLLSSVVPVVAQVSEPDAHIEEITYTGSGNVSVSGSELYLWQSASHQFTATISTTSEIDGELCLVTAPAGADSEQEVTCKSTIIPANTTQTKKISVTNWPTGLNGSQEVSVLVRSTNESEVIARESLSLTVIRKDGDLDGDGLTNEREASLGTGLRTSDTDDDGLSDEMEVRTYKTSPTKKDTDDDGLSDRVEIRTHGTDPTASDTDDDGLSDAREIELDTNPTSEDTDGDGVADGAEVNVHETNPTAPDTDSDGLGDAAEIHDHGTNPLQPDTDDDGLPDNLEVNTYETDPTKIDTDGDGLEDGAEVNEFQTDPTKADSDDDGLTDGQEVNTYDTDPTNPDTDGDELQDGAEVNQYGTNPNRVDTDNDGQSDNVEAEDQGLAALHSWIAGILGIAVLVLAGGGILYRSGRLSGTSLQRLWEMVPTGVRGPAGTDSTDDRSSDETPAVTDDVPPEFLSNQDRILRLLDDHEGRMHQSDIVEETGWSKSKVSRVLTEMEEDQRIVKVDIGRGNIVTRPDDVPSGTQSPFDN